MRRQGQCERVDWKVAEALSCTACGRWVVAGATWFAAGRALWLLPNMLSEVLRIPWDRACTLLQALALRCQYTTMLPDCGL